jgi:excisionase family DNA binding protein
VTEAELRDCLGAVLAPAVLDAITAFVQETVRAELARAPVGAERKWLTVQQAAELLSCSPDAIRMRAKRGRLEHRHQGRSLYIAAAAVDNLR